MFQLDFNEIEPLEALQVAYAETQGTGARTRAYANDLVDGTCRHLPEIDATLAENLYADYRTVANFHNCCLPARWEAHATTHMAMILRNELV